MGKISFNNIKYYKSYGTANQIEASEIPEVAFVGKSNVGKSSIINKICDNSKISRVSSSPGKTTTINLFTVNNGYFVDLPGYGFAKRSKSEKQRWSELIDGYFYHNRNFALVIALIDIRHDPTQLDHQMIDFLHQMGLPFLVAYTKADKLSKQKMRNYANKNSKLLKLDERIPTLITSSQSGLGIQELKNIIAESLK